MTSPDITRHGRKRMRQRLGIPKGALSRTAEAALINVVKRSVLLVIENLLLCLFNRFLLTSHLLKLCFGELGEGHGL